MPRSVDSQCRAFQLALDVLGRPWTALILNVLQQGPMRFSEIGEYARGPGDKVPSARLDLETRGLIRAVSTPWHPVRISYSLSEKGQAFGGVAEAIERWGQKLVAVEKPRATIRRRRRAS